MATCKLARLLEQDVTQTLGTLIDGKAANYAAQLLNGSGYPIAASTIKLHRLEQCACHRATVAEVIAPPADVPEATRRTPDKAPAGWSPRAEYDSTEGGFIISPAWEQGEPEPSEVDLLAERGMDPASWTVTSVRYSEWEQSKRLENGDRDIITLHAKRVNIAPRLLGGMSVDPQALANMIVSKRRPTTKTGKGAPGVFLHAGGDYQLGKTDGDGVDGTVQRFMDALDYGQQRLTQLRRYHDVDTICLPHLGDCIEGYVSQNGRNAARTTYATSEQVDLLIHLLVEQVRHYAPLAPKIIVPVIPGNHDEEARNPDGLEHHSWATFAAKQLRRTLSMAGPAYEHVRIVTPPEGELTLTLDLGGVRTLMAHGHQHGPGKSHDWWKGQAHGMHLAGDATLMLEAHHHHLNVSQKGIKTVVQTPALEGESRWWRHRTGEQSPPGMVTMLVGENLGRPITYRDGHTIRSGWDHLAVA